ncbi:MAG: hypothetical protein IJZ46_03130 [Bacilli bacterium]|nr:hypothetical protein [Bacilli bacterium]
MERFYISTNDGIVTKITDVANGKIVIDVIDSARNLNLTKEFNFFDTKLQEGDSIDIIYSIVGQNINGKVSGSIDFEFKAKELDKEHNHSRR